MFGSSQQRGGRNNFSGFWPATGKVTRIEINGILLVSAHPREATLRAFILMLSNPRATQDIRLHSFDSVPPRRYISQSACTSVSILDNEAVIKTIFSRQKTKYVS